MKVYNKVENDAGNAYLYDATAGTAGHKHDEPDHNMQMICYIEEKNNTDRDNLIDMEVFNPISGNAIKWLRM